MEAKVCFEKEMFFSKTYPSFLTLKEGSTFLTKPLFHQGREDVTALQCCFSKIIPSFFTIKEGSTSHLGLLPSGKKRKTALQCCICPTCPSPAGGSLTHSQALALSKRPRDVTALRCSEPLRYKVGGPSKVCAKLCGMGPPGDS